jgi:SAM-dependent methyltransferase
LSENRHNHFDTIADEFNGLWQMTPEYQNWMSENIVSLLDLDVEDIFVDLGGGTGLYTKLIASKGGLKQKPLCVEPSENMLSQIDTDRIEPVCADALTFSARTDIRYDKILLKEMIHFVENRKSLFEGIAQQLSEKGRLLIVTRPKATPLPFFKAALETFAQGQPSLESMENDLIEAKITASSFKEEFVFTMPKERWYGMLRNRFMSNLQNFTDQEIEEGILQLEQTYGKREMIEFRDEIIFVSGERH